MIKRFFGDTFVYGVARSLPPLGTLLLLPVYTSFLDPADFGIVALFEVEATVLTNVMMLGIDQVIQRYFSDETARELDSFISAGLYLCLSSAGVFLCLVTMLIFPALDGQLLSHAISRYRELMLLVVVQSAAAVPVYFAQVILRMQGRALATNLVALGLFLLRSTVSVVLLWATSYRVEALVFGNVTAAAGVGLCCLYFMRHYLARVPGYRELKEVGYHAVFMWANVLVATAGQTADRISLAALTSARELGNYSVALKVSNTLQFTGATWSYVLQPYFFRKRAGADPDLTRLIGMTATFLAAMAIVVIATKRHLIGLLARGDNFGEAATYIPFLVLAFWLKYIWSFLSQHLVKAGRTLLVPLVSAAGTACLVLALLTLVPTIGAMGAAGALVIHRLVSVAIACVVVRSQTSDLPWRTLAPCGVAVAIMASASFTGTAEMIVQAVAFAVIIVFLVHQAWGMLPFAKTPASRIRAAFWKWS